MDVIGKKICELVFTEGTVLKSYEGVTDEGINVQSYDVEYCGEHYTLTKNNGEWVYYFHC